MLTRYCKVSGATDFHLVRETKSGGAAGGRGCLHVGGRPPTPPWEGVRCPPFLLSVQIFYKLEIISDKKPTSEINLAGRVWCWEGAGV